MVEGVVIVCTEVCVQLASKFPACFRDDDDDDKLQLCVTDKF